MLELITPDVRHHAAWLESHNEWGPGQHEDGFGVRPDDDLDSAETFAEWVDWLHSRPGHLWWIADGDTIVGGIVLRTFTNEWVQRVGHIGYGIRPSARGQGIATWALRRVLQRAKDAGMARVLVVCRDDNAASIKTIERCGGVLDETVHDEHGIARHYLIELRGLGNTAGPRNAGSGRTAVGQFSDIDRLAR